LEFTGQASVPGFCAAAESASPPGFKTTSAVVHSEGGVVAAASPVFHTAYRLDTSLPPVLRRPLALLERLAPKLAALPIVGLGSPVMDRCAVGFRAGTSTADRANVFSHLLDALEVDARQTGASLTAVKDIGDHERSWADPVLGKHRYARMASLPVAVLDLPHSSVDDYVATLSASVRRDLRRKLKRSAHLVRFTECSTIAERAPEIAALYEATRAKGQADYGGFDALSPNYVQTVLDGVEGGSSTVVLGWVDGVLASFALMLIGDDRAYAHQIGMRYPLARDHNLYFLNWIAAVRFCIERGIKRLEFGQTSYPLKLRLGCRLERSWVYVRHRSRPINIALRHIAPRFGFDQMEEGQRPEN
jgi:hypothetical protein